MTMSDRIHTILERRLRPRVRSRTVSSVVSESSAASHRRGDADLASGQNGTAAVADFAREDVCQVCGSHTSRYRVFDSDIAIQHCDVCETESLQPIPSAEQLRAYYNGYGTTKSPRDELIKFIEYSDEALSVAMKSVGRSKGDLRGASYLEIGFGNGSSLFAAARLGAEAVGLDLDPTSIRNAEELAVDLGYGPRALVCGDMTDVIATRQTFEYVKASHVIEHTQNPREFLKQILQVQPVGGVLLLECPNNKALFWIVKNLLRKSQAREQFYNSLKLSEHLWGFTRNSLAMLVESVGYEVVACRDYAVGDTRYQPETALWYPTWQRAFSTLLRERHTLACKYAAVRQFDAIASRFAAGGTGLAVAARKK